MELELSEGRTIPEIVRYAREHPIHPGVAPARFEDYLTVFGGDHSLLFMVEFNIQAQGWEYHFSLARSRGKQEPGIGLGLGLLTAFMAELGIPERFAMSDNIVHIHWPIADDEEEEKAPRH